MNSELTELFKPFLRNKAFQETLYLVRENSQGKIWIMGGFVYKNLASALYGTLPYEYDIDFVVEHKNKELKKVDGWNIEINSYDNPNYVRDTHRMSFTDIHNTIRVSGIKPPTMEDFIFDTPLDIQSIAYDITDNILIGKIGIKALQEKIIRINNIAQAEFYAKRKNKTVKQLMNEKAEELGFEIEI